ncbi:MAG: tRNA pseudouridine(55) synthase TruB [Alphaproteobacteria bacterium]|nr:tRNA pseudouridine(55) synthase TruB [Alphaproteobacteria bacterium]
MSQRQGRCARVDGWLVLDKPQGTTSTAALGAVKRLFGGPKAGHAGTLDPLATGILPIAFGEATKVVPFVVDAAKRYRFRLRFGEERDTDDAEGAVLERRTIRPSEAELRAALPEFQGEIEQVPPRFSAVKLAGERAYDLARSGQEVTLSPRRVNIHKIDLVEWAGPEEAVLDLSCGKGAYVRALARDLGRRLGCLAHVTALRRLAVGQFDESRAISLAGLEELGHKGTLLQVLLPVETALADIPALAVTGAEAERLRQGQSVRVPSSQRGIVYVAAAGQPVALGRVEEGELRPLRVFRLPGKDKADVDHRRT